MNGWESIYNTADVNYNNGNFRDSYTNYIKAAHALVYKFGNEVSFASRDAVKSKPANSTRLFQQLKSCVQRLEDILQNRVTNGVLPTPQLPIISDNATLILTNLTNSHPTHLPLVPFSPLTRKSIYYAHELAISNQQVSVAKQKLPEGSKDSNTENYLRKLKDEVRQQRNKLDQVNNEIQSIAEVTLLHWDAEAVSQQLTIIDSSLFNKVDFKKDFSTKDKKNSKVQACMDFHRYLTNSFTHQFIYADMTRTSNSSRGVQHSRESIIPLAIKVAYLLLNVHRNFNSFAALMKALTSPEVRRIRRLWANLPARTTQVLKELSIYVKKDNDYKAYRDILAQKMELFRGVGKGTIVIPWMQPHYEEIKGINQSYTSGKSGDSSDVILSAPGARKLVSIFALLEQCKTNIIVHDEEDWSEVRKPSTLLQRHRDTITVDGLTITLPLDLSCLGFGNLELHHWLVSRVYLTKQQLIDESIEIEPLGENEHLPCIENDYEEEEEEEEDRHSLSQFGSDDGDNSDIGTSSKHVFESNSTQPLTKVSQDNPSKEALEPLNKQSPSTKEITCASSNNEQPIGDSVTTSITREIPKVAENGKSVGKSLEETPYNLEPVKNDPVTGLSNGKVEGLSTGFSSKTAAIPIPQAPKQIQPLTSPTNLNPHAPVFVPSINSLAGDKINVSLKQLEGMKKNRNSGNESSNKGENEDEEFVYPSESSDNGNKSDDEGSFVYPDGAKEEDDCFLYPFESNSNESNENANNFDYTENGTSPNANKKDNSAKNPISSITTTENGDVPEITVKFHNNATNKDA